MNKINFFKKSQGEARSSPLKPLNASDRGFSRQKQKDREKNQTFLNVVTKTKR
jgi:hypothetical protein